MTREEEIKQAARNRADQYEHPVDWSDCYHYFLQGAEWADQHQKKELWDSEKVIDWILNNYSTYEQIYSDNSGNHTYSDFQIGQFIRNLRKAMED